MISAYPAESSWQLGLSVFEEVRRSLDEEEVQWNFDFSVQECCWLHHSSDKSCKTVGEAFGLMWNVKKKWGRIGTTQLRSGFVVSLNLNVEGWAVGTFISGASCSEFWTGKSWRNWLGFQSFGVSEIAARICPNFVPTPNPGRFVCFVDLCWATGVIRLSCLLIELH